MIRSLALLLLLAHLDGGAQTTTVYRCGPDGREYSATPCPAGQAVDVGDARSVEQRRQAQDAARREKELAERLAVQRRQRDAASPRAGAARLDAPAAQPAHAASKPKGANAAKKKKKPRLPPDPTLSPPMRAASGAR